MRELSHLPLCRRYMDMESFALEADVKGAVVMLALHGGPQANGGVQWFLEEMDVPFTGPSWRSAYLCGNQVCPSLHLLLLTLAPG